MKFRLLASVAAAAAALTGCAAPYAAQEFDFSQFDGGSLGVVERVLHAEENARFVVRLDNGFSLKAVADGTEGFEPGERVRVLPTSRGSRLSRE